MTGGFLGNDISYSPKTPNSQKKENLESAFCDICVSEYGVDTGVPSFYTGWNSGKPLYKGIFGVLFQVVYPVRQLT